VSASNDISGLQVVARCRDALLVDGGSWWAFGRQRGAGGGFGVFVLGLTAASMAVASIAESVRLLWGAGNWILSVVFAVTAALLAIEAMRELRKIRHARAHAPFELDLLLDLAAAVARDRNGIAIARLDGLTFELSEGLRSKSSELECHWEGGKLVLMRTLFAEGHAATPLPALRRLGLRVSTPDILG
jgi:hypothetical protein